VGVDTAVIVAENRRVSRRTGRPGDAPVPRARFQDLKYATGWLSRAAAWASPPRTNWVAPVVQACGHIDLAPPGLAS